MLLIMFTKVLLHKIHLDTVMHQDQQDLINAINELCLGQPTDYTIAMLQSLSRPIKHTDQTVYIFSTAVHSWQWCLTNHYL